MTKLIIGKNDFETYCKNNGLEHLLEEWDYEANNMLGYHINNLLPYSNKKIWWKCKYGHRWKASTNARVRSNSGCPYCSGRFSILGLNDFKTWCIQNDRQDLVIQWCDAKDMTKYKKGSHTKIHWKCDICGYEWDAAIKTRTSGHNCPNCNIYGTSFSEQAILYYIKQYFSDTIHRYTDLGMELDVYIPSIKTAIEYDGVNYHKDKNKQKVEIRKNNLCKENGITLIRIREEGLCSYDDCVCIFREDKETKQDLDVVIKLLFNYLQIDNTDINIRRDNTVIMEQYRLLELQNSLAVKFPKIAKEWHPTLNGTLKPEYFSLHSGVKVWWLCPVCGYEWQTAICNLTSSNRVSQYNGCPECARNLHRKKVLCIETNIIYISTLEAQRQTSVNYNSISACCRGKRKTAGGYHWKYIEN